ncbi:MAG: hypothetical protein ABFD03_08480 [Clostridiaceae bacterium]|nr:hypothetical protein [Feifaniaceae bacterium]
MKPIFRHRPDQKEDPVKAERAYRAMLRERELEQKNVKWFFMQMRDFRL